MCKGIFLSSKKVSNSVAIGTLSAYLMNYKVEWIPKNRIFRRPWLITALPITKRMPNCFWGLQIALTSDSQSIFLPRPLIFSVAKWNTISKMKLVVEFRPPDPCDCMLCVSWSFPHRNWLAFCLFCFLPFCKHVAPSGAQQPNRERLKTMRSQCK